MSRGSILEIDLDSASRGADVQFLSLWPRERELMLPPFTMISCKGYEQQGSRRHLRCTIAINPSMHEGVRSFCDDFTQVPNLPARDQPASERRSQLVDSIFEERVPDEFRDPFSNAIFIDPVIAEDDLICARAPAPCTTSPLMSLIYPFLLLQPRAARF